jgi:RNA polymerase sigma-70 factor (ECF subfamily)
VDAVNQQTAAELTEAFRENRRLIYDIARRICGDDSAADVTQEVFLRLWRRPEMFDPDRGTMRRYLVTLSRGVAIDFLRRETARKRRDDRGSRGGEVDADVSVRAVREEAVGRVVIALASLSQLERDAIVTAFYEDLSYREVASRLGLPEGTVKSRIRLGLQKMRCELHDLHPAS